MHRFPQIAASLHVQPEVGTVAEYAGENERSRRGHLPAVIAQLVDMLALDAHRLRQRGLGQPHRRHELLDKDFRHGRRLALCHQHGSPQLIAVVVEIDAPCLSPGAIPSKDEPPLFVHAYRMKTFQIAAQLLEVIAGQDTQILVRGRIVDHLELTEQAAFQIGGYFLRSNILDKEGSQPIVPRDGTVFIGIDDLGRAMSVVFSMTQRERCATILNGGG